MYLMTIEDGPRCSKWTKINLRFRQGKIYLFIMIALAFGVNLSLVPYSFCPVIESIYNWQPHCLQLKLISLSAFKAIVDDGLIQKIESLIGRVFIELFAFVLCPHSLDLNHLVKGFILSCRCEGFI
jgi:hypothetical protein